MRRKCDQTRQNENKRKQKPVEEDMKKKNVLHFSTHVLCFQYAKQGVGCRKPPFHKYFNYCISHSRIHM